MSPSSKELQLFEEMDANGTGIVSLAEIEAALEKHAAAVKMDWRRETIALVVQFFDRDGDGELDKAQYAEVVAELKRRVAGPKKPANKLLRRMSSSRASASGDDAAPRAVKQRTLKLHKSHPQAQLGITFALPADPAVAGLVVVAVEANGMCASLKKGDIVHSVNGRALLELEHAAEVVSALASLGKVDLEMRVSAAAQALSLDEARKQQEEETLALALAESKRLSRQPMSPPTAEEAAEERQLAAALALSSASALEGLTRRQSGYASDHASPRAVIPSDEADATEAEAEAEELARALSASRKPLGPASRPLETPEDAAEEARQLASALALSSASALQQLQRRSSTQLVVPLMAEGGGTVACGHMMTEML